jgi:N-acyl-D-amino-acid deacylase
VPFRWCSISALAPARMNAGHDVEESGMFRYLHVAVVALLVSVACSRPAEQAVAASSEIQGSTAYDVVIVNGRVVDGTGAPWIRADIGIRGDRIAAVGNLKSAQAGQLIDANGLVVAPGFIDLLGQSEFNVLVDNRAASKITQGITTEITGEGTSIAPVNDRMIADRQPAYDHFGVMHDWRTLNDYFGRLQRSKTAINIGTFVGSGGIRDYVIGKEDRPATAAELDEMRKLVAQAMEDGALGVSSSLQYVPNRFASTEELIELAKVAARYGGIYITHQRSEGNKIFESLDEVFTIAERADVPAEIWHLKTAYKANWGKMAEVLRRIEAARARGLRVSANIYPYNRASNGLDACFPLWVREGGVDAMIARLKDPAQRERIKKEMNDPNAPYENQWYGSGGPSGVMVSSVLNPDLRKYEGMTLDAIGKAMGKDPRDAAMDLVIADRAETSCIIAIMNEDDVRTAMRHPLVSFDTDSGAQAEDGRLSESKSHPRAWGTFTRILGRYVRDEKLLTLEEAVRKMTSQAANRVGIMDRGIIRPGMFADLTVFDPATVRDVATFEDPKHYSTGVRFVLVNGRAVVSDGKITDERPGRPLFGPGRKERSTSSGGRQ